jgi:hypothetical protein
MAGGMDNPSCTKSHPAASLSSSKPGGSPCWAGPLAFGLIGDNSFSPPHSSLLLSLLSVQQVLTREQGGQVLSYDSKKACNLFLSLLHAHSSTENSAYIPNTISFTLFTYEYTYKFFLSNKSTGRKFILSSTVYFKIYTLQSFFDESTFNFVSLSKYKLNSIV